MQKTTVEYFRAENNLRGYSFLTYPAQLREDSILNYLCEWSKGKEITIYSHALRRVDENDRETGSYFSYGKPITKEEYDKIDGVRPGEKYFIPYCDWVYYLDIWWQ